MSLLTQILDAKRAEIDEARARPAPPRSARTPHDPQSALARAAGQPLHLIAEVKFKSPSAGKLSSVLDAAARAHTYAACGATMISVLCDGPFFGGGWADLGAARAQLDSEGFAIPLLAKEFILDEMQLDLAAGHGADSALLIVRILDRSTLGRLVAAARTRGMEPLVEITDETELATALGVGAQLIGVNARDLDTLVMDPERAARVLASIPADRVAIHLSGIKSADSVAAVARGRADAALLGEALMREDDPSSLLRSLVTASKP